MPITVVEERIIEQDRIPFAIGLRLLSSGLFMTMNATMKLAQGAGASIGEILFWRQFGAAMLVSVVIAAGPGLATVRTQRLGTHVTRAIVGVSAMGCTFTAVLALPLAESTTINFTVPIFATVLGAFVLDEATGWRRWAAVGAGFAGVLIVTRPEGGHFPLWGVLAGLGGAFGTANISILLRRMGRTEGPLTIVFWFSVLSLLPLGLVYAAVVQWHGTAVWGLLLAVGLLGGTAQIAMTGSLRFGPVSVVVPMDYSGLLWATLLGWLLFGTLPVPATWVGAPLIVGSGLFIVWREHARRRAVAEVGIPAE